MDFSADGPAPEGAKPVTVGTKTRRRNRNAGFSLLEMMLVVVIILIIAGMAIISINGTLPQQQATAGLDAAMGVFRQGRDSAISQRRFYQLLSGPPLAGNQLQLERIEINGANTQLPAVTIPSPAWFGIDAGVTDTPDGFCPALPPSGVCFGSSTSITQQWLSDGTFADTSGAPINATIFVHLPGTPGAQRAFTVLGTTGRIRAYKWTGSNWVLQ
jgi:prepilin-type N-terminal cleavage/methylation domain-containing protein